MQPGPEKFLITALRLQDGKQLWQREDPDLARTFRKAVAVDDGKVFVATDAGLKALDCRSGKLLWHTRQKQIGEKTPNCLVVSEGRIILSFKSGAVVAFTHSDGSILWKFRDATARLALYDNKVIFDHDLLPDHRLSVRAVAAQSGDPLWQTQLRARPLWLWKKPLLLDQLPMVSRGLVIVCPEETYPTLYRNTLRTYVAALNIETGAIRWRSGLPSGAIQSMACDGERVYVICYNGEIRGLSLATGRRLWKRRLRLSGPWAKPDVLGHVPFSPPVVSGRVLLVAGYGNELFGLSCATGEVLWKIHLEDSSIGPGTQLLVAGNRLVIVHSTRVWAFKPAGTRSSGDTIHNY